MARFTVTGPATGTCDDGALRDGILVRDGAHLDLSFAAVTHIHNTPLAACFRVGHGITIGDPFGTIATATIEHSDISDYGGTGIIAFGDGSLVDISENVITGAGLSTIVATSGIEFVFGAAGTISHNVISGNSCGSPDLGCGTDYLTQFQIAGIQAGGPGTVITHNEIYDNQVGIYAFDGAQSSHNKLVNNHFFGL
ncbi:MAG: right-handed parallel beta-helix repeat-containing protein, partial [Bryobacteraceae bacterium]